ncbi:hypothetical protein MMC12_002844, partial [Toensbergia leucococca]|nr:hypothetical protein [Toensbergia leucococca]
GSTYISSSTSSVLALSTTNAPTLRQMSILIPVTTTNAADFANTTSSLNATVTPGIYTTTILVGITTTNAAGSIYTTSTISSLRITPNTTASTASTSGGIGMFVNAPFKAVGAEIRFDFSKAVMAMAVVVMMDGLF